MRYSIALPIRGLFVVAMAFGAGGLLVAQQSPYTDFTERTIKALSAEEVKGLMAGDGLGFALAAELNGYPGPKHVLELADSLALTEPQRARVDSVFRAMREAAQALGRRLVEAEAGLDSAFAAGTMAEPDLEARLDTIAQIEGRLRYVHLRAHLATRDVLSEHQRMLYARLRGYAAASHRHGAH